MIDTMDRLNELLEYIQRTNPGMTKEKLIKELKQCSYTAKSLIFTEQNFLPQKISSRKRTPLPPKIGQFKSENFKNNFWENL